MTPAPTWNDLPDPVRKPFAALWPEIVRLHFRWRLYKQLYGEQKRVDLLNDLAMGFFYRMQFVMLDDVVLTSAKLLDRRKGTLSLHYLVEQMGQTRAHASVSALKAKLETVRQLGAPLIAHRHKRIAHADLDHHPAIVGSVLPGITADLIERLLKGVAEIVKDITICLNGGGPVGYPASQAGDGYTLIWNLCKAADYDSLIADAHERAVRLESRYREALSRRQDLDGP